MTVSLDSPLLTTKDVARVLRVSERSVYRLVEAGRLAPIRLNPAGRLRFAGSDVERLIGTATAEPAAVDRDAAEPAPVAVRRASGDGAGSPIENEEA